MSGPPKRLHGHDEGSHPITSKRPDENSLFSNLSGKFSQSIPNEYHPPFVPVNDGRFAKFQRVELRDADKRSSLPPLYRMPSSSFVPSLGHLAASENRPELREAKDNRGAKTENRETKVEARELFSETRVDSQAVKGEKDVRLEGGGDDKEIKSDKETQTDNKVERDGYTAGNSHLNGNDAKDSHRGKRYSESPSDGLDPWRVAQGNSHSMDDIGKEASTTEERECPEAHETVGENKVDLRAEEKFKEKERKRKDRDWGEREKDRNDHRNSLQLGSAGAERKESTREEKEMERWEMEKRDVLKDKERLRERDKDHIKRESLNVNEKELHNGKGMVDGSVRKAEQESPESEQKRLKQLDSSRTTDRDDKEQKKEKDLDVEGDRHDKSGRPYKESDDGCTDGDGVTEREREVFGHGVQQRRRMLRTRGSSQAAGRESRFRSRIRDNEGSQGKSEVSTVVYKAGECMQELLKLWKEYEASQDSKSGENSPDFPTLEIRIPAEYVTATNRQVRGGQLWGTDVYTDDSDLVAVLMHTGYCRPTTSAPPPAIHELRATIRVLPPQECYTSTLRNSVRSRAWGAAIGCSYRVEKCRIMKKGGGSIDLQPCLTNTSVVEPTLAPVAVERTMTTRAAASNALRQQRFVREVTIQYNLCNEPWIKYSISAVADKGLKKPLYTSARLKKGEVLYLETHSSRYELCFCGEKAVSNGALDSESQKHHNSSAAQINDRSTGDREHIVDVFRWSRCKKVLPQKIMRSIGIPLPAEHVEVLADNIDWEDVQWSQIGVSICGKEYTLARVHFLSPK